MRIDTNIAPVGVEIEGREYPLAPRTAALAEKLRRAEQRAVRRGRPRHELELEHLELLLGRGAVRELFCQGGRENLDRLEAIYYGVLTALEAPARARREEHTQALAGEMKALAEAVRPLAELAALLRGGTGREAAQDHGAGQ